MIWERGSNDFVRDILTVFGQSQNLAESVDPLVHLDLSVCGQVVRPQRVLVHRSKAKDVFKDLRVQTGQDLLTVRQIYRSALVVQFLARVILENCCPGVWNAIDGRWSIKDEVSLSPFLKEMPRRRSLVRSILFFLNLLIRIKELFNCKSKATASTKLCKS